MSPLRHPRTMMEAFPADHWRGVITHYSRPRSERIADVLMAVILGLCAAAFCFYFLSR